MTTLEAEFPGHYPPSTPFQARRAPSPVGLAFEPCACGGMVVSHGLGVSEVTRAMRTHQATRRHAAWRKAEGL